MTFLHKLAHRLALMKDRRWLPLATRPWVAARFESFAVAAPRNPQLERR